MGGMLVMGIGYIIWGFIAPRFAPGLPRLRVSEPTATDRKDGTRSRLDHCSPRRWRPPALARKPAAGGASRRPARWSGSGRPARIRLGYRTDARPFSFGRVGRAGRLLRRAVPAASPTRSRPSWGSPTWRVEWVPVTVEDRFAARAAGRDRPAVRRRHRDPGAGWRTSPSRSRSSRAASGRCCGRTPRPAAGRPEREAAGRSSPTWRASAGAAPAGAGLRRRAGHDGRDLARRQAARSSSSPRRWCRWTSYDAGVQRRARPQGRRLLRRPRHPAGRRDAQPVRRRADGARPPLHLRAARARARRAATRTSACVVDRTLSRLYRSGGVQAAVREVVRRADENALAVLPVEHAVPE